MLKRSEKPKSCTNDFQPRDHSRYQISSKPTFSNSKRVGHSRVHSPSQITGLKELHADSPKDHKSISHLLEVQQLQRNPTSKTEKKYTKVIEQQHDDSRNPQIGVIRDGNCLCRKHRQKSLSTGAKRQPSVIGSVKMASEARIRRRKSSVSARSKSNGSQMRKIQSSSRQTRRHGRKINSLGSPNKDCPPTYVCEKHKRFSRARQFSESTPTLSPGDHRILDATGGIEEALSNSTGKLGSDPITLVAIGGIEKALPKSTGKLAANPITLDAISGIEEAPSKSTGKLASNPITLDAIKGIEEVLPKSISKLASDSIILDAIGGIEKGPPKSTAKLSSDPITPQLDIVGNAEEAQPKSAGNSALNLIALQPEANAIRTSYSIPIILTRKLKLGEDPKRIPADMMDQTMVHTHEYFDLSRHTSALHDVGKNPNNCTIKVIKFQNVEIIEQHDPQTDQEAKPVLKIVHKSRELQPPRNRVNLVSEEDTELTKMLLSYMLDSWADVVKMWNLKGFLEKNKQYEMVDLQEVLSNSGSSGNSDFPTTPGSAQQNDRNGSEAVIQFATPESSPKTRKTIEQYLRKKGPAYYETITTQLRYNFHRRKRFYPVHLMEHVLKFKRPPFWNYTRKYGGFNALLNKYQLEHLCELVPPKAI